MLEKCCREIAEVSGQFLVFKIRPWQYRAIRLLLLPDYILERALGAVGNHMVCNSGFDHTGHGSLTGNLGG